MHSLHEKNPDSTGFLFSVINRYVAHLTSQYLEGAGELKSFSFVNLVDLHDLSRGLGADGCYRTGI